MCKVVYSYLAFNNSTSLFGQDLRQVRVNWDSITPGSINVNFYNHALGCGDSLSIDNIEILKSFIVSGTKQGCSNTQYTYSATDLGGSTFDWEVYKFGTGIVYTKTAGSASFNYTFNSSGNYEVRAYNSTGLFCNSVYRHSVSISQVAPPPPSPVGDTVVCSGQLAVYQSSAYSNNHFLEWNIAGGAAQQQYNGELINVTWDTTGVNRISVYNVSKSFPYCKSDSSTLFVFPYSDFFASIDPFEDICLNTITEYEALSYVNHEVYNWYLDPPELGTIISGQGTKNVSVQYNNEHNLTGYLMLELINCNDTILPGLGGNPLGIGTMMPIHSYKNPEPSILGLNTVCLGEEINFIDTLTDTNITKRYWDFGDGQQDSAILSDTITHVYNTQGSFIVSLSVVYGGKCPDSITVLKTIDVFEEPIASLTTDTVPVFCPTHVPTSVGLNVTGQGLNSSSNYNIEWLLDSIPFTPSNPNYEHEADTSGIGRYLVKITNTQTGCFSFTNSIYLDTCQNQGGTNCPYEVNVHFTDSIDPIVCGKVYFDDTIAGADLGTVLSTNYLYGDGSSDGSGIHTYSEAGFYVVTLNVGYVTTEDDTCSTQKIKTIEVPLHADYDYYLDCDTGSSMKVVIIDNSSWVSSNISTIDWTPNATGSPTYFSRQPGTYFIKMKVISALGSCEVTKQVDVDQKGLADFTIQSEPYCEQIPVSFNNTSTGPISTWVWDHGDSTQSLLDNSSRAYSDINGAFFPRFPKLVITDANNCKDSLIKQININDNRMEDEIDVIGTNPFCVGDSIELESPSQNTMSPYTYLWSTNEVTSSIFAKYTGIYRVTISDGFNCVYRSPSIATGAHHTPSASPFGSTVYCPGDLVEQDMFQGFTFDYTWLKNGAMAGDSSYLQYVAGSGPRIDSVEAVVSDNVCRDTTEILIEILEPPVINSITASPDACESNSPSLMASVSGNGLIYNWSNGDTTNPIKVDNAGIYRLTLTNEAGCDTTSEIEVFSSPDFSTLMTGCYDFCSNEAPIVIQGLYPSYYNHTWLDVSGGSPSVFSTDDTLVIDSAGNYSFRLYASNKQLTSCGDTSDVIEIDLWDCSECSNYGIIAYNFIQCKKRDSLYNWEYEFEILVQDSVPGTIVISPEQGQVYSINKNVLTKQNDYISGKFRPISDTTDSICLNIEIIDPIYGKCNYRICDTLQTCHMPCKIDSIFMDSISCLGLDEHGKFLYYFESRIYNGDNDYQYLHASIDSGSITGLSLDSLAPGMNTLNGYIHSIDSGYQCLLWGFYLTSGIGEDPECCEQEYCLELPSCSMPDTCDDIGITEEGWEIECIGTDLSGNSVYQFEFDLNNSGSVHRYKFGSNGGYLYGLTPNYIVSGSNILTGFYRNTGNSDSICISFTFIDTTTNETCYYEVCGEIPGDGGDEGCEEAMPCDIGPEDIQIYCRGTNGDGEPYYEFTLGVNNPGMFVGSIYSASPNMWINSPSTLPSGMSVLKGGFIPYGLHDVCYRIFMYDSGSQTYCQQELCFDNFPTCCEELMERRANPEKETPKELDLVTNNFMRIFPNPTSDQVNISFEINEEIFGSITVFDLYSNQIDKFHALKGRGNFAYDFGRLENGIYFVALEVGGNVVQTSKIVVIH